MSQEMFLPQETSQPESTATAEAYQDVSSAQATTSAQGASVDKSLPAMAKDYVQQYPGKALLISAALGLVIALLLPGDSSTPPD